MGKETCPQASEACKYYPDCFSDLHHIYHPSTEYTGKLEKAFRNLGKNCVQLCRQLHDAEHAQFEPPEKPDRAEMAEEVEEHAPFISAALRKALDAAKR